MELLKYWFKFGSIFSKKKRDLKLKELRNIYHGSSPRERRRIEALILDISGSEPLYNGGRYKEAKESFDSDNQKIDQFVESLEDFNPVRIDNRSSDCRQ